MNIRKLAMATAAGSVVLIGCLAVPAAHASTAPAPHAPASQPHASVVQAPTTVAGDNWEFVGYYYWESDCHTAGQGMVTRGEVKKYRCDDGSWVPGDDYELEVVWNR